MKFCKVLKDGRLIKKIDNPDRNLDCRSKSEKAGFRSKIFDRDQTFSDFDPERIAIGGRIGNRIETISNSRFSYAFIKFALVVFKTFDRIIVDEICTDLNFLKLISFLTYDIKDGVIK